MRGRPPTHLVERGEQAGALRPRRRQDGALYGLGQRVQQVVVVNLKPREL